MLYDEIILEMLNPKIFLDIIKVCVSREKNCATITNMKSHVFFPY